MTMEVRAGSINPTSIAIDWPPANGWLKTKLLNAIGSIVR